MKQNWNSDEIFDSMKNIQKVPAPVDLHSKITSRLFEEKKSNGFIALKYAAAIILIINAVAVFLIMNNGSDLELDTQYDQYVEHYNWSENDYYEYLTIAE
ncbi:MAG: hypothetical protein OCD76_00310 [Reichenbachiella sp.]